MGSTPINPIFKDFLILIAKYMFNIIKYTNITLLIIIILLFKKVNLFYLLINKEYVFIKDDNYLFNPYLNRGK